MAEAIGNTVTSPDLTEEVNQQFFIEPLSGSKSPISDLEHFPETLYNRGIHTNLVSLLYALLGPVGVGGLRQNYLEARLQIENAGLSTTELDYYYNNIFAFARLAEETYEEDTEGLLTQAQYEKIQESDKSYQSRAKNFLAAARAGGTLLGMALAAKSGLNRSVEVIENYRALYDEHSDDRLGIEYQGVTRSTEEIILLPRQEMPTNAVQVLKFVGEFPPLKGEIKLKMPLGIGETVANTGTTNPETGGLLINAFEEPRKEISAEEVQVALEALPGVGKKNLRCSGGPLPTAPIEVEFINELSDREIPPLLVTRNTSENIEGLVCILEVEQKLAGVSADGSVATVPPEDWHFAETAIDQIKPVTTIVSPGKSPGITKRQVPSAVATDSQFSEVIRYVTGSRRIEWPPVSLEDWIVQGEEREAPKSINGGQSHYVNYHNVSTVTAYTEKTLESPGYEEGVFPPDPNEKNGTFSPEQQAVFPFLASLIDTQAVYSANDAAAPASIPTTKEGSFVEGCYPLSYTTLPGAEPETTEPNRFWASSEREEGIDIIEVDLGTPQAVNYIMFEASNAPYEISVAYDLLDAAPARYFTPVTYTEPHIAQSELALGFNPTNPNFWRVIELNFTNPLGEMIFTRFIRLEFAKRTNEGSIFTLANGKKVPFSIEVRNVRVGRNIS